MIVIKIYVDKYHKAGDFWLTGSQIFSLMQGVQESLAGRVAVLSMSSLSQGEILGVKVESFCIDLESLSSRISERKYADTEEIFQRIFRGSMPAIANGVLSNSQIFYSSYLSTYLDRDIKELYSTIDSLKFYHFLTSVAARCGQMLNVADITRDADLDQKHIKSWLSILETLGIIFFLHP